MDLSSRWCVTAVIALGALACSDPVPPPAQGATYTTIGSVSPPVSGKSCPAGASYTYDVPPVRIDNPTEILDGDTYKHKIIDGESGADVSCSVRGSTTFTFSGHLLYGGAGLDVTAGTVDATLKGTATITVTNSQSLSSPLASPPGACAIEIVSTNGKPQIKGGSMWAHYKCSSVESPPSDSCAAEGYFVLENCEQ